MVTQLAQGTIQWLSPSPMWGEQVSRLGLPEQQLLVRPTILRFANDAFVEELLAMLNHAPWRITEWIAQPETWREPMTSPEPVVRTRPVSGAPRPYNGTRLLQGDFAAARRALVAGRANGTASTPMNLHGHVGVDAEEPIKLYQASHQRYYIVTASLTSAKATSPDYALDLARNERATFVVRGLVKADEDASHEWDEYAFVTTSFGPAWQKVGPHERGDGDVATRRLVPGEEQLGTFPVTYSDHCDRQRQVLGGLIPVGRREEWLGAPAAGTAVDPALAHPVPSEPRGAEHLSGIFNAAVVEPWKALVQKADGVRGASLVSEDQFPQFGFDTTQAMDDAARKVRDARDQIQTGSWYVLLDFANFLEQHLPNIWDHLNGIPTSAPLDASEQALVRRLRRATLSADHQFALAMENLLISNPDLADGLWDKLVELWELEEALGLDSWPDAADWLTESEQNTLLDSTDDSDPMRARLLEANQLMADQRWYTILDLLIFLERATTTAPGSSRLRAHALNETVLLTGLDARFAARLKDPKFNKDLAVEGLSERKLTIVESLRDALVAIKQHEADLEAVDVPYARVELPEDALEDEPHGPVLDKKWPNFLYPLADPDPNLDAELTSPVPTASSGELTGLSGVERVETAIGNLAAAVDSLLVNNTPVAAGPVGPEDPEPILDQRRARFVVRYVFERPWCGELFPPLLSRPTRQFELAPFFDPDAPARPIRIQLPVDISPAGLRKFKKNTSFLISDMLCGKIKKIRKITLADMVLDVLPWPFHKDLPRLGPTGPCRTPQGRTPQETLGMVCSLSIPIVTLCALILLFVIVALFDRFFRWIPYLFVCFPLRLKGKET